jgi:hypothetical protein
MKANEFVKRFGWDAAKYKADELKIFKGLGGELSIEDAHLMRLVESYELVEKLGGLESCNRLISQYGCCESSDHLRYHVTNVESCQ